jgi:hypothetical protein
MMAKKSSAKGNKKSVKAAAAAPRAQRGAAPARGGKAIAKVKYQQSGAPWWKQFLPG